MSFLYFFPWKKLLFSPYSVRMRENADQSNSEYGHFLRSATRTSSNIQCRRSGESFKITKWLKTLNKTILINKKALLLFIKNYKRFADEEKRFAQAEKRFVYIHKRTHGK